MKKFLNRLRNKHAIKKIEKDKHKSFDRVVYETALNDVAVLLRGLPAAVVKDTLRRLAVMLPCGLYYVTEYTITVTIKDSVKHVEVT